MQSHRSKIIDTNAFIYCTTDCEMCSFKLNLISFYLRTSVAKAMEVLQKLGCCSFCLKQCYGSCRNLSTFLEFFSSHIVLKILAQMFLFFV